jgi:gluconate kinase
MFWDGSWNFRVDPSGFQWLSHVWLSFPATQAQDRWQMRRSRRQAAIRTQTADMGQYVTWTYAYLRMRHQDLERRVTRRPFWLQAKLMESRTLAVDTFVSRENAVLVPMTQTVTKLSC